MLHAACCMLHCCTRMLSRLSQIDAHSSAKDSVNSVSITHQKSFKSERQLLGLRQKEKQKRGSYLVLKEILQNDYDSLQSFENLRPESGLTWKDD
jgi:hypothetical protein